MCGANPRLLLANSPSRASKVSFVLKYERQDGGEMNEIIKVNDDNMTVSARDLHDALGVKYDFKRWVDSNFKMFSEGTDYFRGHIDVIANRYGGSQSVVDYKITINMAEHICLMSQTEKGKICRQYLIDLEKAWNTPEQVMARALRIADKTIASLKSDNARLLSDNERMKPKEEFFDAVADSKDAIEIGRVAKVLNYPGMGRNNLKGNIPYQKYIDNGYFRTIEQKYCTPDGETRISIKTLVYQKGVDAIRKMLEERSIIE